jgi:hypothetical protein
MASSPGVPAALLTVRYIPVETDPVYSISVESLPSLVMPVMVAASRATKSGDGQTTETSMVGVLTKMFGSMLST